MISILVHYQGGDETSDSRIIVAAQRAPIGGGHLTSGVESRRDLEWRVATPGEAAELVGRVLTIPGLDVQLRS